MASQNYTYRQLDKENSIRVLELKPGQNHSPIEISLRHAELGHSNTAYEAISYTWGDICNSSLVRCEGKELKIPKNLLEALSVLRLPSSSRYLWADSICIAQSDDVEKSIQVTLMGRVYKEATRVIVWLGIDPGRTAAVAFKLAQELARLEYPLMPRKSAVSRPRKEYDNPYTWLDLAQHIPADKITFLDAVEKHRWEALTDIYHRGWFTRIWVIQEVGLASCALVVCGNSTIAWQELVDAAYCIGIKARPFADHFQMNPGVGFCFELHSMYSGFGPKISFVEVLRGGRKFFSADSRDKVYALLSHPSARTGTGKPLIEPNYNPNYTMDQLNLNFAIQSIRSNSSLQTLAAVEHRSEESIDRTDIPSWVPRWEAKPLTNMLWMGNRVYLRTATEVEPRYEFLRGDRVLKVSGLLVGTISNYCNPIQALDYRPQETSLPTPVDDIKELLDANEKSRNAYPTEEQWLKAQYKTLTVGRPEVTHEAFESYRQVGLLSSNENPIPSQMSIEAERFAFHAGLYGHNRRIFITDEGYVGLGPCVMREQDLLCVLFGCAVPFILRRQDHGHKLVGECYLRGIMEGQAVQAWSDGKLSEQEFLLY